MFKYLQEEDKRYNSALCHTAGPAVVTTAGPRPQKFLFFIARIFACKKNK